MSESSLMPARHPTLVVGEGRDQEGEGQETLCEQHMWLSSGFLLQEQGLETKSQKQQIPALLLTAEEFFGSSFSVGAGLRGLTKVAISSIMPVSTGGRERISDLELVDRLEEVDDLDLDLDLDLWELGDLDGVRLWFNRL